jgi:spermidine/putrescine transport system substrate-binding protein
MHRMLADETLLGRTTRGGFLRKGAALGIAGFAGSALAGGGGPAHAASGGSNSDPATIKLGGYDGWIGNREFSGFAKAFPGSKVEQVVINVDGDRIAKLATDPSVVDIMLITEADVSRIAALGLAQKVDLSKLPNYAKVASSFKFGAASVKNPICVATDYGKTGFGYRKDLVSEKLTSWADVWKVASKYSGKITFLDYNMQTIPSALKMLGHSASSTNESEIKAAGKKLQEIKPHLQSFTSSNMAKGLLDGSVVIAMDWDYDMFTAMQKNPNIVWVNPKEGMLAYLDTWVAINHSKHLDVVWDFMNFHFAPRNYANFINTTGAAFCERDAKRYIKPAIANSPVMFPSKQVLSRIEFGKPVGKAQAIYDRVWQDVKAS